MIPSKFCVPSWHSLSRPLVHASQVPVLGVGSFLCQPGSSGGDDEERKCHEEYCEVD